MQDKDKDQDIALQAVFEYVRCRKASREWRLLYCNWETFGRYVEIKWDPKVASLVLTRWAIPTGTFLEHPPSKEWLAMIGVLLSDTLSDVPQTPTPTPTTSSRSFFRCIVS